MTKGDDWKGAFLRGGLGLLVALIVILGASMLLGGGDAAQARNGGEMPVVDGVEVPPYPDYMRFVPGESDELRGFLRLAWGTSFSMPELADIYEQAETLESPWCGCPLDLRPPPNECVDHYTLLRHRPGPLEYTAIWVDQHVACAVLAYWAGWAQEHGWAQSRKDFCARMFLSWSACLAWTLEDQWPAGAIVEVRGLVNACRMLGERDKRAEQESAFEDWPADRRTREHISEFICGRMAMQQVMARHIKYEDFRTAPR